MMADMLGSMHLNTLTSDFNLACNLTQQGKHAEAEPILRRVLAAEWRTRTSLRPCTTQSLSSSLCHAKRANKTVGLWRVCATSPGVA